MGLLANLGKLLGAVADSAINSTTPEEEPGEQVPQSEFEAAVQAVADGDYDVASAYVRGTSGVTVRYWSNSRKQKWESYLDFDLDAGTFSWTSPYGSVKPKIFGDEVLSRLGR